jgi:aminoglycoside phosphotransferase (APT) family kinase protein
MLERVLPFIELQADEVAAIISPVVQAAPEELKITPLSGSFNTGFRVTHSSRDLMIRLITGDLNAYVKEFNLLSHFAEQLPLPAPLHFQISSQASRGFPVAIHDWIEGITLEEFLSSHPDRTATVAQSVGRTLSQFAEITFPTSGFLSSQLSLTHPFKIREPMWQYISHHGKWMDKIPTKSNLVNGNFRRTNILVNPASEGVDVVGLLNWDFAMSWTSLFDISQLLESPFPKLQEFEKELLQTYVAGGGQVPEGWTSIRNQLQLLSWCDLLARPATHPSMMKPAIDRISVIIRG